MSITTAKDPANSKILIINLPSNLDHNIRQMFVNSYTNAEPTIAQFVIELSKTTYIDSYGLGMLLVLKEFVEKRKASLILKNPTSEVKELLLLANFDQLFKIV